METKEGADPILKVKTTKDIAADGEILVKYLTVPENKIFAGSFGFTLSDKDTTFMEIRVSEYLILA